MVARVMLLVTQLVALVALMAVVAAHRPAHGLKRTSRGHGKYRTMVPWPMVPCMLGKPEADAVGWMEAFSGAKGHASQKAAFKLRKTALKLSYTVGSVFKVVCWSRREGAAVSYSFSPYLS